MLLIVVVNVGSQKSRKGKPMMIGTFSSCLAAKVGVEKFGYGLNKLFLIGLTRPFFSLMRVDVHEE